jgi:hypothetical protein
MMRFGYFQPAIDEIDEALAYYQAIDQALSQRLVIDIEQALAAIAHMPESWKSIGDGLRQKTSEIFPLCDQLPVAWRDDLDCCLRQYT